MRDFIRERWRHDLRGLRCERGNVDVPQMVAGWLDDPAWTAAMAPLAPGERRLRLAELGAETFACDAGNFAAELRWNTRSLGRLWSPGQRDEVLRRHVEILFASASDQIDFMDPLRAAHAAAEASVTGLEHLQRARDAGRGIIFLGAYQCPAGFALHHHAFRELRIGVVQHMGDEAPRIRPIASGGNHFFLPATGGSMRNMLRLLLQGGAVALYNDFIYPGVTPVASTLFGKPVLTSRAIVALALRTRAAVLPMAIVRHFPLEENRVTVELFPELMLPQVPHDDHRAVEAAAMLFGVATECLIRRYPAQWRLWNSLDYRWSQAESARSPCAEPPASRGDQPG